jgi:monoamine oxidase
MIQGLKITSNPVSQFLNGHMERRPEVTRSIGRIHFAGAYAAQMSWGQEAALKSANRAALEVDRA